MRGKGLDETTKSTRKAGGPTLEEPNGIVCSYGTTIFVPLTHPLVERRRFSKGIPGPGNCLALLGETVQGEAASEQKGLSGSGEGVTWTEGSCIPRKEILSVHWRSGRFAEGGGKKNSEKSLLVNEK